MNGQGEIKIIQGSTNTIIFEWFGSDGLPIDLSSGYTAQIQARPTEQSDTVLFDLSTADNEITLGSDGKITAVMSAVVSGALTFSKGVYELTLTKVSTGEKFRLVKDRVVLDRSLTR